VSPSFLIDNRAKTQLLFTMKHMKLLKEAPRHPLAQEAMLILTFTVLAHGIARLFTVLAHGIARSFMVDSLGWWKSFVVGQLLLTQTYRQSTHNQIACPHCDYHNHLH
jgi:hypothetical protein